MRNLLAHPIERHEVMNLLIQIAGEKHAEGRIGDLAPQILARTARLVTEIDDDKFAETYGVEGGGDGE